MLRHDLLDVPPHTLHLLQTSVDIHRPKGHRVVDGTSEFGCSAQRLKRNHQTQAFVITLLMNMQRDTYMLCLTGCVQLLCKRCTEMSSTDTNVRFVDASGGVSTS